MWNIGEKIAFTFVLSEKTFSVITHMKEKNLEDESENDIERFT